MPDLDVAIEAAAEAITQRLAAQTGITPTRFPAPKVWAIKKDAEAAITAAEPLIRADERAKVRAELLAIAAEYDRNDDDWPPGAAVRNAARRIAPESIACGHCHDDPPRGHVCPRCGRPAANLRQVAPEPTPKEQR